MIHPETYLVLRWIDRMTVRYGHGVWAENGKFYDWGQSLCVEMYGYDHENWPDYPTSEDVERALEWENGDIPSWVDRYDND